ncbi:MAG: transporter substrate-binding domain-containing protein [Acidobacteriaceae bacterium]
MRISGFRAVVALVSVFVCVWAGSAGVGAVRAAIASSTLEQVRASGVLRCGVDQEEPEYSTSDDHGGREAFDEDLCRAVAVAVLGEHARVQTVMYPDDGATMAALRGGAVDMVPTLSDDFTHSVGTHMEFTRPVLWDGVGFLVLGGSPVMEARGLAGRKICFIAETHVEESVRAWFAREHVDYVPFPFQEEGEMEAAFATGNCGALAGDRTRLAGMEALLAEHGKPTRLLSAVISKDPLAAAVRDDDPQWASIVNWVMEALVQAEESGVTQANVEAMRVRAARPDATNPVLRFLLGGSQQVGGGLGLENDWVVHVVKATGNYGEIYERDLGSGSALKLPRGQNRLVRDDGLMIALPFK